MERKTKPSRKLQNALLQEKIAVGRASRILNFQGAPLLETRARLEECALSDVHEPPAEFEQEECRALLAHLERLEARYRLLYNLLTALPDGRLALDVIGQAVRVPGFADPSSSANWGR